MTSITCMVTVTINFTDGTEESYEIPMTYKHKELITKLEQRLPNLELKKRGMTSSFIVSGSFYKKEEEEKRENDYYRD